MAVLDPRVTGPARFVVPPSGGKNDAPPTLLPSIPITPCSAPSDPLSDVLETFPLEIRFAGRLELASPWGLGLPEGMAMVFAVAQGRCVATADTASEPQWASAGEVVLLSPGAEHRLCDAVSSPVVPPSQWLDSERSVGLLRPGLGGRIASTVLVGGVFPFDDVRIHPFCWGLPPVVHLASETVDGSGLLRRLVRQIDDELATDLPGRAAIVGRLVEVLFVAVARLCLPARTATDEGIARLLHPELGPALAMMRRQPEKQWTVADLAERVTMSRSAFAAAFAEALGRPPLAYLRQRRMELAARLLGDPSLGLKEVAQRVGYDSVSAFNSAFRRHTGIPPGRFRGRRAS